MKYLSVHVAFDEVPNTINNFKNALKRIGELDPENVRRTTLRKGYTKKEDFSEKDYINRGVLNIRKLLNSNLGKNGKYTNRMILLLSDIKVSNRNKQIHCLTRVPHADYINIVKTTYRLLNAIDKEFCYELLNNELQSTYRPKAKIKKESLRTTAPVQTHIILMSDSVFFNKYNHKKLKYNIERD